MIYLDHASTSPINASVLAQMQKFAAESYFNISSAYPPALLAREQVEQARKTVAAALKTSKETVCFTSCATESNNWVILNCKKRAGGNIIISGGEHESVYRPAMELKAKGYDVRVAKLQKSGHIDLDDLRAKTDQNTCLASIIHCSNETGAINDLAAAAKVIREKSNALIHSDGVQAFCKLPPPDVDFYTVSAHKIGGAKGIGALMQKKPLNPLLFGGGQERGSRSGTENTAGIIAFAAAIDEFLRAKSEKNIAQIYKIFKEGLLDAVFFSGEADYSNWILQASFPQVKSEVLMNMLFDRGVIIGLGSACSSKKSNNRVLAEAGLDKNLIEGSIRLSFSPALTADEAASAVKIINETVKEFKNHL